MKRVAFSLLALFCAVSLQAQVVLPEVVSRGLLAYKATGGQDAITVWMKGSPSENEANPKIAAGDLAKIEATYGKMIGFDPIRMVSLTPSLLRVHVAVKYDRGPLFFTLDCYKSVSDKDWVVYLIDFNANPEAVFPREILMGLVKPI